VFKGLILTVICGTFRFIIYIVWRSPHEIFQAEHIQYDLFVVIVFVVDCDVRYFASTVAHRIIICSPSTPV